MRRKLILVVAGLMVLYLGWMFSPGGVQQRGINAAGALRRRVQPRLAAEPRFADVHLAITTRPDLYVSGEVPDSAALRALHMLIQAPSSAKFRLMWDVRVATDTALEAIR